MKKIGVIITTHGNYGKVVANCIKSYLDFLPTDSYIVCYVNESTETETLALPDIFKNVKFIFIQDQKANGGLTGTWNQGIDLCLINNCEIIVLSNNDLVIDASFENILKEADNAQENKELKYFGPVSNNPGKGLSHMQCLSGSPIDKDSSIKKYNDKLVDLNGFLMVFPKNSLIVNKFNSKYYFDPKYPFGGNEVEWFNRFLVKGGKPYVVYKTFVKHFKFKTWRNIKKKQTVAKKSNVNLNTNVDKFKLFNNYSLNSRNQTMNNYYGNMAMMKKSWKMRQRMRKRM